MIKDIVEPMFASMLPGPLATLHFVKIDLGRVPMRISKVDTHRIESQGIKLDMDVDWDGQCDIELNGKMMPKIVSIITKVTFGQVLITNQSDRGSSMRSSLAGFLFFSVP